MSKRVLVTGIGGFAGRYLSPVLADAGFEVIGLVSEKGGVNIPGMIASRSADLRNLNELKNVVQEVRPTHVIHLAAISFVGHENVRELYETNIVGTKNLLLALNELNQRPNAVLLTSSANVYGNSENGILDEAHDVSPPNDYAISKLAMEYVARQFFSSLNIIIARPFNYTGRGQSANFIVPKIVDHFRRKAGSIELGNLDVARDFSDVRMTVEYFLRMIERPKSGQIYNICSGKAFTLDYIIRLCEHLTGHRMRVEINDAFVRKNELKYLAGNPEKIHHEYGAICNFPFDKTVEWMLSQSEG